MNENEETETTETVEANETETAELTEEEIKAQVEAITFKAYQDFAYTTAVYDDKHKIIYPTLGLAGEAGEVAEKMKKIFRDNNGEINQEERIALAKELGDVLWYVTILARDLAIPLHEVALMNVQKLRSRQERNQLHGEGDDR